MGHVGACMHTDSTVKNDLRVGGATLELGGGRGRRSALGGEGGGEPNKGGMCYWMERDAVVEAWEGGLGSGEDGARECRCPWRTSTRWASSSTSTLVHV